MIAPGEFLTGLLALFAIVFAFSEGSAIAATAGLMTIFAVAIISRLRIIIHELRGIRLQQLRQADPPGK